MKKKIIVIGNGKIAIDCLRILLERDNIVISKVVFDPSDPSITCSVKSFCEKHSIASSAIRDINCKVTIDMLKKLQPDLIFNINSHTILHKKILDIPTIGAINFHNGPLPKYRGHGYIIPSWAIFNGETEHGVTWHFMDYGVDTGNIIAQNKFKIQSSDTALALNFKCLTEGTKLFEEFIDDILNDNYSPLTQQGIPSRYKFNQLPNNGYIDFNWPYDKIDRLLRATDFRPYKNIFTYAKAKFGDKYFIINSASLYKHGKHNYKFGEITKVTKTSIHIAIKDSIIEITEAMDKEDHEISIEELIKRFEIKVGDRLNQSQSEKLSIAS